MKNKSKSCIYVSKCILLNLEKQKKRDRSKKRARKVGSIHRGLCEISG